MLPLPIKQNKQMTDPSSHHRMHHTAEGSWHCDTCVTPSETESLFHPTDVASEDACVLICRCYLASTASQRRCHRCPMMEKTIFNIISKLSLNTELMYYCVEFNFIRVAVKTFKLAVFIFTAAKIIVWLFWKSMRHKILALNVTILSRLRKRLVDIICWRELKIIVSVTCAIVRVHNQGAYRSIYWNDFFDKPIV